jgi:hypothetical protein
MSHASLHLTTITTTIATIVVQKATSMLHTMVHVKGRKVQWRISLVGSVISDLLARSNDISDVNAVSGSGCSAADGARRVAMATTVGDGTDASQLMLETTVLAAERVMAVEAIVRVER